MFKKKEPIEIGLPNMEADLEAIRLKPKDPPPYVENALPAQAQGHRDEGSWNEPNHQPNSLHYREIQKTSVYEQYRNNLLLAISGTVIAVVLLVWGALAFSEDARLFTMEKTKKLAQLSMKTPIGPYVRPPLQKFHKVLRHRQMEMSAKKVVEPLALSGLSCSQVIKEALNRKLKGRLSADDRYLVMSCSLFQDAPQQAVRQGIDGIRNIANLRWEDASEYLLFNEAQRRVHVLDARPQAKIAQCGEWKFLPACLVRFLDESALPHPIGRWEDSYNILEKELAQQADARTQAWFYIGAGQHALKSNKNAELYFKKARDILDRMHDPFLEREIFRGRVRYAFHLKDAARMEAVWDDRPFERLNEDPTAFMDLDLMRAILLTPVDAENQLRVFLEQPQSFQRFRFDYAWVRFVVEQTILTNMGELGLSWLQNMMKQGKVKDDVRHADIFGLLQVRMFLASNKYLDALELMARMERTAAKTAEWHQLRGLSMLGAAEGRERRIQAAKEFQAATNQQPQSASPFALIVTFLEIGQPLKAEVTLAYWGQMKREDDFLYIVARGLVRYGSGDVEAARQIWKDGLEKFPKKDFWKALNRNLGEDPQYFQKDLFKRLKTMLATDSPLSALALWRQKP